MRDLPHEGKGEVEIDGCKYTQDHLHDAPALQISTLPLEMEVHSASTKALPLALVCSPGISSHRRLFCGVIPPAFAKNNCSHKLSAHIP